jgi:tRNA dimethylallyltransferase
VTGVAAVARPRPGRSGRPPVVLALVGPTAAGKSAVALAVAPRLRAEIVSVDSMQVYRGMDVGTAKPTPEERRRVPHHLIDVVDPARPFSVAAYQRAARAAIEGIHLRGRTPLLVGGSGLYYRAVVDDLRFPPTDPAVRRALEGQDPAALAARLRERDPEAAARIDPANVRRVIRALEVIELTGRRASELRAAWDRYESRYDLVAAGLLVSPAVLRARIQARVDRMLASGLVEEVRGLLGRGLRDALTAARAIGYAEVVASLDGALTLEEARRRIVRSTRRYARRQMTWFRADPRIRWFPADDLDRAVRAVGAYYEEAIATRMPGG